MDELDIEADEQLILSRKYRSDGRGDIKVNGCPVNAAMLRRITAALVDVHGQSEHFYLLSEANQLKLIDQALPVPCWQDPKEKLAELLAENRQIAASLRTLGGDEKERGRRIDILQYQMKEIDEAALREGEEEELSEKKLFLQMPNVSCARCRKLPHA